VKTGIAADFWLDTLLLGGGLALLVGLAYVLTRTQEMNRAAATAGAKLQRS
jgi:hypothetical protein